MKYGRYNSNTPKETRTYDGIVFDSKLEMKYYVEYVLPALASGELISCERQVKYQLQEGFTKTYSNGGQKKIRPIDYVADFVIVHKNGLVQIIDTKGALTPESRLKEKMFLRKYSEDLLYVTYSKCDGGWIERSVYEANKKARKKAKAKVLKEKEKFSN